MNYINCTPHPILLNTGETFQPSGTVARVSVRMTEIEGSNPREFQSEYGDLQNVPEPVDGVRIIVSNLVLQAGLAQGRKDLVAPATGHSETVRDEKGHIVSVPGFVRS